MNKKRRPRHYNRRPEPNCKRGWELAERIAHFTRTDPLSGCDIWQGNLKDGYGSLRYQGKTWFAHRLAWEVKHGPIPDGLVLRHRCNVRRCCNPDHLVPGTRAENNADQKAERLRLADARAATVPAVPGSAPDLAPIRIFYHGVELKGDVAISIIEPALAKTGSSRQEP
jgi:hypothetical protein